MDERPHTGAQPGSAPRTAEIVGYGLLATAVAAGVLYLDGQRPRDIAVVVGAILALLVTLVLIAPRLRVPEQEDAVPRARYDEPAADDTTSRHDRVPPQWQSPTDQPAAPAVTTGSEPVNPESDGTMPARSASPGRRAKRGRRRR